MKISVNDKEVFTLTSAQLDVFKTYILGDCLEGEIRRRIHWVITHKFDMLFEEFKKEWDQKLKENGVRSTPLDTDSYVALVTEQQNYKSRADLEQDAVASGGPEAMRFKAEREMLASLAK